MNNQRHNFYRALLILNSLLFPVFILSLIEKLNLSPLSILGFIPVLLIVSALKIYCMSGIGGCLLEIISGEEFVLRIRQVHQNAKNLWPGFMVFFAVVFVFDFFRKVEE